MEKNQQLWKFTTLCSVVRLFLIVTRLKLGSKGEMYVECPISFYICLFFHTDNNDHTYNVSDAKLCIAYLGPRHS